MMMPSGIIIQEIDIKPLVIFFSQKHVLNHLKWNHHLVYVRKDDMLNVRMNTGNTILWNKGEQRDSVPLNMWINYHLMAPTVVVEFLWLETQMSVAILILFKKNLLFKCIH